MRLNCPACGAHGSFEFFASEADARACYAAAQKAIPGDLLLHYLGLFRPGKRLITWKRCRSLLEELTPMIESGQVQRDRRTVSVTIDAWRAGIEQMLNQRDALVLPLKSHGYLLSIVAGQAPKRASAAEAANEELRRVASSARSGSRSQAAAELASEIAVRKRLKMPEMTEDERQQFMRERGAK